MSNIVKMGILDGDVNHSNMRWLGHITTGANNIERSDDERQDYEDNHCNIAEIGRGILQ